MGTSVSGTGGGWVGGGGGGGGGGGLFFFFFFNDTATTEIYTLSLHDALPICHRIAGESTANTVFLVASLRDSDMNHSPKHFNL